ncbi:MULTISPECIES: acyl carrier protein [Streptomyces]|uniref:acyl carrier protein n=1 Tax=Streptomyces TaxID=1883 RepID=UPI001E617540|nr:MULTISPECIES: acyl carrier protein [Streptomyces]UFQ17172.1 acyl carrier protein [Streptomyces huasconensis]WCL86772.1 acyl carrier protein [Streptomyces sp. JCM 35825]
MPAEVREAEERQRVLEFVTHVIEDVVGMEDVGEINLDTSVGPEGLGLESIGALEVAVQLEREYDIEFPDEMLQLLLVGTLGEFIDEVIKKRSTAGAESSGPR